MQYPRQTSKTQRYDTVEETTTTTTRYSQPEIVSRTVLVKEYQTVDQSTNLETSGFEEVYIDNETRKQSNSFLI
jgi:hypothetical protein